MGNARRRDMGLEVERPTLDDVKGVVSIVASMWATRFERPSGGHSFRGGFFISVFFALPTELTLPIKLFRLSGLDLLLQLSNFQFWFLNLLSEF